MFYGFRASVRPEDLELVDKHLQEVSSATDAVDDELMAQIQSTLPVNVVSITDDIKDKELHKIVEEISGPRWLLMMGETRHL